MTELDVTALARYHFQIFLWNAKNQGKKFYILQFTVKPADGDAFDYGQDEHSPVCRVFVQKLDPVGAGSRAKNETQSEVHATNDAQSGSSMLRRFLEYGKKVLQRGRKSLNTRHHGAHA